jgi:NTE family protein
VELRVLALEALDEMGISPAAIAGRSVGDIIGGAYAAGINGRAICESSIASLEQSLRCDQRVVAGAGGTFR